MPSSATVAVDVGYSLLPVTPAPEGLLEPKGSVTAKTMATRTTTAIALAPTRRRREERKRGRRMRPMRLGGGIGLLMISEVLQIE